MTRSPVPPDATGPVRLKRTVEAFPAADGAVYLLRGGADADHVVDRPDAAARALLAALEDGAESLGALRARLAAEGVPTALEELTATLGQLDALGLLERPGDRGEGVLDGESRERYDRQLAYFADARPGEAAVMQRALLDARVVVIGVGGLGSWTAAGLASAGVGHLTLVDDDRVELSNLNRQVLFRRADVGRPKAEVAADALRAFNPCATLVAANRRVRGEDDVLALARGADLVVDTADSPVYELARWVNRACWALGVPWTTAAQFPPHVRIGPTYIPGATACLACQEEAARAEYPGYDELAAFRIDRPAYAATLGPASGIVGSLLAMEAVHLLTGLCRPMTAGAALILDLQTHEPRWERVRAVGGCRIQREIAERLDELRPLVEEHERLRRALESDNGHPVREYGIGAEPGSPPPPSA